MSEFTPGPWEYTARASGQQFDITPVAGGGMGWVKLPHECPRGVGQYMQVGGVITEADARLIAAAPEMLNALKACRTHIAGYNLRDGSEAQELIDELFNELQRIHDVARAAVAKATGAA